MKTKYLIVCITDNFFMTKKELNKYNNTQQIVNIDIKEAINYIEKNINRISTIILYPNKSIHTSNFIEYIINKRLNDILMIVCKNKTTREYLSKVFFTFFNVQTTMGPINPNNKRQENIDLLIEKFLSEFGASPKLKGYQYVKEAINLCIIYNHQIKIYKDIYGVLSTKYNTTDIAIESAIRRLIDKVMDTAPWEIKNNIFSSILYNADEEKNPSNLLFIKTIAERINTELKKENTLFL